MSEEIIRIHERYVVVCASVTIDAVQIHKDGIMFICLYIFIPLLPHLNTEEILIYSFDKGWIS